MHDADSVWLGTSDGVLCVNCLLAQVLGVLADGACWNHAVYILVMHVCGLITHELGVHYTVQASSVSSSSKGASGLKVINCQLNCQSLKVRMSCQLLSQHRVQV